MEIRFHPHAIERLTERGASQEEVIMTLETGEQFPAKFGRTGFRRNFEYNSKWREKFYSTKQVEAYAAPENKGWIVITVIVKFF